jgi:hypothetical protein
MDMCCNFLTSNAQTLNYIEIIDLEVKYIYIYSNVLDVHNNVRALP